MTRSRLWGQVQSVWARINIAEVSRLWQLRGMSANLTQDDFMGHLECLLIEQAQVRSNTQQSAFLHGFYCHDAVSKFSAKQLYLDTGQDTMVKWPNKPVDICIIACANRLACQAPNWLDEVRAILRPNGAVFFHAWGGNSIVGADALLKPRWAVEDIVKALNSVHWVDPQVMMHNVHWDIANAEAASREMQRSGYKDFDVDFLSANWPQIWSCDVVFGYARHWSMAVVQA